jgi:hypothetical protein
MNKYLALTICFLSFSVYASQRAVTDEGNIVILNSDGTWEYESPEKIEKLEIKTNNAVFKKGSASTFRLKSTKNKSEFWINPKDWSFKKADDVNQAEYQFQLKGTDLYGMAITEKIQIDLDNLTQLALENAKDAAPDAKIVTREYRIVNGNKVMYMEIEGTIQGIRFKYLGYYYSDSSGSTQYLTYTGENLVSQYKNHIEKFLNGFSIQ